MRSYIFTEKERALLSSFLEGKIMAKDRAFHVIVTRVRHFNELASDVDLYLKVSNRLIEPESV
jgi:hypothetical protein